MAGRAYVIAAAFVALLVGAMIVVSAMQQQAAAAVPTPTPAGPPTVGLASVLTTMPGFEKQAQENPAVVNCRVDEGDQVTVRAALRETTGSLYLMVQDGPRCVGWLPAHLVENYPAWADRVNLGEFVER